jgi:hypothetical protein
MGRSRGTAVPRRQLLRVLRFAATSLTVGFWRAAGVALARNLLSGEDFCQLAVDG